MVAEECRMGKQFDYDLSDDYTHLSEDKCWMQQSIQVQTAKGPAETKAFIRDLDHSLMKALHAKHKLGQSNLCQDSLHVQLWDQVQPFKVETTQ